MQRNVDELHEMDRHKLQHCAATIGQDVLRGAFRPMAALFFSLVCNASDKWRTEGQTVNKYNTTGRYVKRRRVASEEKHHNTANADVKYNRKRLR